MLQLTELPRVLLQRTYRIDFKTMKEFEVGTVGTEVDVRRKAAGKGRLTWSVYGQYLGLLIAIIWKSFL